jgi:ribosomal protein S27AE
MTDKTKTSTICKKCGKQLDADEKDAQYCGRCMIERAEEYVPEALERPPIKRAKKSRAWLIAQVAIILAGVAIMALQTPRLISAVKGERPLRQGTYATDAQADQCIKNLWHIARLIQEGKVPGPDIVCPISRRPYAIKGAGADVWVSCPNPELHGFKAVQVSKRRPAPELSK